MTVAVLTEGLVLTVALSGFLAALCWLACHRAGGRRPGRNGPVAETEQELPPDPAEDKVPLYQFASRDYFLAQCKAIDLFKDRVALVLIQPDPEISELEQFLKRLELTLRSAIRRDDWLTLFLEERLLLMIGQISLGNGEAPLARLAEVIRREELAWCVGKVEGARSGSPLLRFAKQNDGDQAPRRSSAAIVVYPTDGTEFQALMDLARRRLEQGICWNIQPST